MPNDYDNIVDGMFNTAPRAAMSAVDDNPDDAARAIKLGQATGAPATSILSDLPGADKDFRAGLTDQLVRGNPQLDSYINSHPLAASVSNDDWGNLDQISQKATTNTSALGWLNATIKNPLDLVAAAGSSLTKLGSQITAGGIQGATEGFQEGFSGALPEGADKAMNPQRNMLGSTGALASTAMYGTLGLMAGAFGATVGAAKGAATAAGGESFGRDIGAMTEYEMIKGDQVWHEAGKQPPRGVDPKIDAAKAELNAHTLDQLEEVYKHAQQSTTYERSPEMFQQFMEQHYGGQTISISGDAAAALYGDEIPAAGDGKLGFVDGMADQIAAAKSLGTDVQVPIADWLTHAEPEVVKALHDDIRTWPGGITATEAKDVVEPKMVIDGPIPQVRGAAGLEPMFAMGDRKLQLMKQEGEAVVGPDDMAGRMDTYHMLDEKGTPVGQMRIGRGDDRELLVDWVGGKAGMWANSFGPSLIRDLKRQLKTLYPDYDYLTGYRISGARDAANAADELRVPRVRLDADAISDMGQDEAFRQHLQGAWSEVPGQPGMWVNHTPTPLLAAKYIDLANAVHDEVSKLTGDHADVRSTFGISSDDHPNQNIRGMYAPFEDRAPIIFHDLLGPDPIGTGRHESIHYLKRNGFFTPEEWGTLEHAAYAENWLDRYHIDTRYPNAPDSVRAEEAVAEAFREWVGAGRPMGSNTAGIFGKLWDLLQKIKARIGDVFGRQPTWEELFQKTAEGEVGQRGPGAPMDGAFDMRPQFSVEDMDGLQSSATGLDLKSFQKIQALIKDRYAEDLATANARAEKEQARTQTREWRSNRADMMKEVDQTIRQRPDVAADLFLGSGEFQGQKLKQRFTLREDDLTPEQRAALPEHYVSKNGLPPDEVGRLFGYPSGDMMVEKLAALKQLTGDLSPQAAVRKIVEAETDRQMAAKHGQLDENIMTSARDQALSDTNLNILAEEMHAAGMRAGTGTVDAAAARAEAKATFEKMPVGAVDADRMMEVLGKHGRDAERGLIAGKSAEALVSLQRKYMAGLLAREASDFEKEQVKFDKVAKRYAKPYDPTKNKARDADYSIFTRDILGRIGQKNGMTAPWLAKAIGESGFRDLGDFVEKTEKANELAGLELPVPDFLLDPSFKKNLKEMSVAEGRVAMNAVRSLDKFGKDEAKVIREGKVQDLAEFVNDARMQLKDKFTPVTKSEKEKSTAVRAVNALVAASTNNETLMSRFDGRDPHGLFTETITYPAAEGANYEARLQRETAGKMKELGKLDQPKKLVSSPFVNPQTKVPLNFTRENLMAVVSNMGNDYNWKILAKGWGLDPDALWSWVEANTKVEDIQRAQKMGDIFKGLKRESDMVYQHMYGVAPENITVRPFQMHGQNFDGWYHPIIGDSELSAFVNKLDLPKSNNFWPSTSNSYMKRRTGANQVLDLSYDSIPARMGQVIHDIAFREPVANIAKIFKDQRFRQGITQYYGKVYLDEMDGWLNRIAGADSYQPEVLRLANKWSDYFRQNVITTQIAFNLGTVEKHGPTALAMSARELDHNLFKSVPLMTYLTGKNIAVHYGNAVFDLFGKSNALGEDMWNFVKDNSEEIQRRERNYQDTMMGQQNYLSGQTNIRGLVSQYGAKLVAWSDMISAIPLWLAKYREEFNENGIHGDAVRVADSAVRRAHGSTAVTNLPRIATGNNPITPWMTSLYGFMGTSMQRRIEIFHDLNDVYNLGRRGDINAAAAKVPQILASVAVYVLWTGIVEEGVASQFSEDHRSLGQRALTFAFGTAAQSVILFRDMVHDALTGEESSGLITSPVHDFNNLKRDLGKSNPMDKEHAGKLVQDGITFLGGDLFGVGPRHIGTAVRYGIDAFSGFAKPRNAVDVYRGVVSGSQKLRVVK